MSGSMLRSKDKRRAKTETVPNLKSQPNKVDLGHTAPIASVSCTW